MPQREDRRGVLKKEQAGGYRWVCLCSSEPEGELDNQLLLGMLLSMDVEVYQDVAYSLWKVSTTWAVVIIPHLLD